MVKRKSRKRNNKFFVLPVSSQVTLGTATSGTVVQGATSTLARECLILSAKLMWSWRGFTAGEGPIQIGLVHNDLTVAETAEALDATPGQPSDIIEREQASRPVRQVGFASIIEPSGVLSDGRLMKTKLMIKLDDGFSINLWARNISGAQLTTGGIVLANGHLFGVWL